MIEHALRTAAEWGDVLPLNAETRKPLVAFDRATSDPDTIHTLWTQWPSAGVGLAAWASSLLIVDVEHVSKGNGDGFETMAQLTSDRELGPLPATRTHRTKSGGAHYVFALPRDHAIRSAHHVLRGLDDCSTPGVDIVSGRAVFRWPPTPGYTVEQDRECATLPDAWLRALTDPPPVARAALPVTSDDKLRRYALAALDREMTAHAARSAGRNVALAASAFSLGQLSAYLDVSEIESMLLTACEVNGSLKDHGRRACLATIRRQVRAGAAKPRRLS